MCLAGASGAGAELLAAVTHPDLRAYYVWVPMLPPDSVEAAAAASARFAEPRALHYWDGERRLAREMAEALRISARDSIGAGDGPGERAQNEPGRRKGKCAREHPDDRAPESAL